MPPAPPVRPRPRPRPYPPCRGRVTLALEELERREVLSPVVTAPVFFPTPPQTPEGVSIAFAGGPVNGGSSFAAFDLADTEGVYTADLIVTHGTLALDTGLAAEHGVGVTNNGTSRVTLTGQLTSIDSVLHDVGYTFTPDAYYSGDATLALSIPDPAGLADGYGEYAVQVLPVVQPPGVSLNFTPALVGPGPVVFAPGAVVVGPWADADGSETVSVVLGLSGGDPTQFTLTAGGAAVPLDSDFQWVVGAADAPTLQALLDSLVLTLPAGFRGMFALNVTAVAEDVASFPSTGETTGDSSIINSTWVSFRYFGGGAAVTAAPLATSEGQPLDLGGAFAVTDPDDGFGDVHTLTLTAPAGAFVFDPAAGSFAATVTGSGTSTLTITGSLADVSDVLAAPGALAFDPPAFFAGELSLTVSFDHQRTVPGKGESGVSESYPAPTGLVVPVRVSPVASFPGGGPRFEIPPLVPVGPGPSPVPAGLFQVFDTPDADGSESLAVVVAVAGGPTPGFVLAAGGTVIPRQADGTWVLTAADVAGLQGQLDTLTLTPAGGLTGLGYSLEVGLVVTDTVTYPSDGTTATDASARKLPMVPLRLFAGGLGVGLTPVVVSEGQPVDLGGNAVGLTDPDGGPSDTYWVTLRLGDPTAAFALFDPTGLPPGVNATGFGTPVLTIDGDAAGLGALFASAGVFGFTPPTATYSGLVSLTAGVTAFRALAQEPVAQDGTAGAAAGVVLPTASSAGIVSRGTEVFAPSTTFAPGAGFFYVFPWADADGSETGVIELSLAGGEGFTLAVNGVTLAPVAAGRWVLAGASAAELQAQLDALTLTPPAGFAGRVTLAAAFTLTDTAADIPAADTTTASTATPLRFFAAGAAVGPAQVTGTEGSPLPLGGTLTAGDPNDLPGDRHTLTLTVPTGTLVADPTTLPSTVSLTAPDAATVVLDGPLADIAAFLSAAGSLTFDPQDSTFLGTVALGYELALQAPTAFRSEGMTSDYTPPPAVGSIALQFAAVPQEPVVPVAPPEAPTLPPTSTPAPPAAAPVAPTTTEPTTTTDTTTTTSQLPPLGGVGGAGQPGGPGPGGEGGPTGPAGPGDPGHAGERPRPDAIIPVALLLGDPNPEPAGRHADQPAPAAAQSFTRAEPPALPAAVIATERHPLPPVLPLDPSAPVAGFTDSGGDSLALLDELLREVAPVSIPIVVDVAPPARTADPAAAAGDPTAWAAGGEPTALAGSGWPFDWLAAGFGLAAAAWVAHGRGVGRWCRRALARLFPPRKELA